MVYSNNQEDKGPDVTDLSQKWTWHLKYRQYDESFAKGHWPV